MSAVTEILQIVEDDSDDEDETELVCSRPLTCTSTTTATTCNSSRTTESLSFMKDPRPPTPPRNMRNSSSAWKMHPSRRREARQSMCPLSPGKSMTVCSRSSRLVFESPRLEYPDSQLFPVADNLVQPQQRWMYMSNLAAGHQQDGRVLRVRPYMTPRALSTGMPTHAAQRVRELHLPKVIQPAAAAAQKGKSSGKREMDDYIIGRDNSDQDADDTRLPSWLDAIVQTFHNLQHLYLNVHLIEEESENSKRLRRLYVLYRLPDLVSIDGVNVTETERKLARPVSPNGQRVSHKNWLKQRLAEHDERQAGKQKENEQQQEEKKEKRPKRNTQEWLSEVLDEKKEADGSSILTHQQANVEVDLAGKMTQVALSPLNIMANPGNNMANPEVMYETTSSVATADCEWAATCGHFFRPDSMRKQWSKSRLRFSSARRSNNAPKMKPVEESAMFMVTPKVGATHPENVLTENEHWTVVDSGETSPIMSKNLRPKGTQPPRLVLDAAKGSPDRASTLIIKPVPPTAPAMPVPAPAPPSSSSNTRCPPSRSLSSPFPMQFRARTAPPQQRPASPPKRALPSPQRNTGSPQRISSMIAGGVSPRRDTSILDAADSPHALPLGTPSGSTKSLTITGLCKPVPMKRTKSTPVVRKGKRDLPPPCPGGGRRLLRLTPRVSKFKKQTARTTSIMDNNEEESEEEEEETTLVVVGPADTA